jgi:GNAT superfamily N-acetyltransferase
MSDDTLRPRLARPADYAHFVRLARELGSGGPVPPEDSWTTEMMPTTLVFEDGALVVGYTFVQPLVRTGYVRHVVIAPTHRGRGHGLTVMRAAARLLESRGCTDWCLHVIPTNTPAVRLYERCGMRPEYTSQSIRMPWAITGVLPRHEQDLTTRRIEAQDDEAVEAAFALARGQLASVRSRAGRTLVGLFATQPDETCVAVACFDPRFPGASPFRVRHLALVAPLLDAIRPLALPGETHLSVMVENHDALAARLLEHGGAVDHTITHMAGPLPLVTPANPPGTRAHD